MICVATGERVLVEAAGCGGDRIEGDLRDGAATSVVPAVGVTSAEMAGAALAVADTTGNAGGAVTAALTEADASAAPALGSGLR